MKDTAPTPPDMSKEQAAELKQLRRAIAKVESDINREEKRLRREIAAHERALVFERTAVQRGAQKTIKQLAAGTLKMCKPLRTQLMRLTEGRAPAFKTRDAIARRIAILEGRQAS